MLKDRIYTCEKCQITIHKDINASVNILRARLKSFGLGITTKDSNVTLKSSIA